MSAAAAELAELRERLEVTEARLRLVFDAMRSAYQYAGVPLPEGLQPRPRSRSHLRLIREEVPR